MNIVLGFNGPYAVLSNNYLDPVMLDDVFYPCITNAVQASKFPPSRRKMFTLCDPATAAKAGSGAPWTAETTQTMYELLDQKFAPGFKAYETLKATGDAILIYANNSHQNITGHCICARCANRPHQNLLGQYLMKLRDEAK